MTPTVSSPTSRKPIAGQADWHWLLCCPDCTETLSWEGGQPACPHCGRAISSVAAAWDLLPRGVGVTESHYISGFDSSWKRRFIEYIYARHNHAPVIIDALARVTAELSARDWGLNLGSGNSSIHARLINLDISNNAGVDVLGDAHRLPFQSNSLQCVISQEVLEHLASPHKALAEAHRVLKPGGTLFVQVPFIIGLHSLPHDYWRFTGRGLAQLVGESGFEILECRAAGGAGTSIYRIGTEFVAALAGALSRRLYAPTKALAALLLSPLRWFDLMTRDDRSETNRIPPGYFCIARKVGSTLRVG